MNQASLMATMLKHTMGEQKHWFCQTGKCDVVELFSSNTGLSCMMSRLNMKVGKPIITTMVGVSTAKPNVSCLEPTWET